MNRSTYILVLIFALSVSTSDAWFFSSLFGSKSCPTPPRTGARPAVTSGTTRQQSAGGTTPGHGSGSSSGSPVSHGGPGTGTSSPGGGSGPGSGTTPSSGGGPTSPSNNPASGSSSGGSSGGSTPGTSPAPSSGGSGGSTSASNNPSSGGSGSPSSGAGTTPSATTSGGSSGSSSGASYNGNGKFSWYNDAGYGACGTQINAANDMLAAVPSNLWTAASANSDPLCKQCVKASYKGKSVTVPIKDKCPGCSADKVDLSKPAFSQLDNVDVGIISGASWSIGSC